MQIIHVNCQNQTDEYIQPILNYHNAKSIDFELKKNI